MAETQKRFEELLEEVRTLRERKNKDYSDSFLKSYNKERIGNCFLLADLLRKTDRVAILLENDNQVKDETIFDTLKDLAAISLNAVIALEHRSGKK